VKPAARVVVDGFRHGRGEANDIVVQDLFQFALAGDETGEVGKPFIAAGFDLLEILGGDDAFLHQRFAGEEFDLEPDLEFVFVGPDGPHLGAGIASNHAFKILESQNP